MKESHVFILNTKTYSQYLKLKICLNLIGNIKAIFKLHGFSFPLKHLVKFISDKKALPKNSFFGKKITLCEAITIICRSMQVV